MNDPIDETSVVSVDGTDHRITLRGADCGNTALLIVGTPGMAFSAFADHFTPWERHFTLVQWDQPGVGAGPLTFGRLARDGIFVAEAARRRLSAPKIVLLAISGGTITGLKMIRARPDVFSAYVGTGQIVNWARQDDLSYRLVLDRARAMGDEAGVSELKRIGPPPYAALEGHIVKSCYAGAPTAAEQTAFAAAMGTMPPADAEVLRNRVTAAFDAIRAEITSFDADSLGLGFDVPMIFLQGAEDLYHVTSEVESYAARLTAPRKHLDLIPAAGAFAVFLREAFLDLLLRHLPPDGRFGG